MDKFYCYLITNQTNGKVYVRITNNPKTRWKDHKKLGRSKTQRHYISALYRAMDKYSVDNFIFEIISTRNTRKKILNEEIKYIEQYNSFYENGYNSTKGGDGCLGKLISDEQKKLLSKLSTKQMSNPENRELSKNGAVKQWENMSDKELQARTEGMRQRAFKMHSDPIKRANTYKKMYKKVVAHGVVYESVNACAEAFGVRANTITYRCQTKSGVGKDFHYLKTNRKEKQWSR